MPPKIENKFQVDLILKKDEFQEWKLLGCKLKVPCGGKGRKRYRAVLLESNTEVFEHTLMIRRGRDIAD
jgi:hypothetical protein